MLKLLKIRGYKNWMTAWYVGFFAIVIFVLTAIIYIRIENQTWSNFDYSVSQLGEEMLDEIFEFRDNLNLENYETINLTEESKAIFARDANRELKEESFDNQLPAINFVQFYEIVAGQQNLLYQSPEISDLKIEFIQPSNEFWGYQPFSYQNRDKQKISGIGYAGLRDFSHYFVGFVFNSKRDIYSDEYLVSAKSAIYQLIDAIDREDDRFFLKDAENMHQMINKLNGWAYIYIYESDHILWATKDINESDIYIPSENSESDVILLPRLMESKEYFYEVQDKNDRNYRQYTLVSDITPEYVHRIDIAVPSESIRHDLNFLAFSLLFADLILVCIVWAGGRVLMRRTLRPVNEVIKAVNDITTKNLNQRLPLPDLDIEIVEMVQTFNQLLDRLAESFETQKTFIADASHELRTPLSILIAEIETAAKSGQDQSFIDQSLSNSIAEIERMVRIVDDLHLLAVTDAGRAVLNKQNIRLDELLMSTVSRCQVFAAKKNIKLTIDQLEVVEYEGDEELLLRAVSNIVDNAIKYSHIGGQVKLLLDTTENNAIISISDDGIGISPEDQIKIFDRFYRVDSSRSRETGGSGLGLAISKWILEIHKGNISVQSEIGYGSTFRIDLPLK
jgi:signal transduction histidine kinase